MGSRWQPALAAPAPTADPAAACGTTASWPGLGWGLAVAYGRFAVGSKPAGRTLEPEPEPGVGLGSGATGAARAGLPRPLRGACLR